MSDKSSRMSVSRLGQTSTMKPLGQNNSQYVGVYPAIQNKDHKSRGGYSSQEQAGGKVTAKADSTGAENYHVSGHIPIFKHHHSVKKPQTPSVAKRNARERNRVKAVNSGFDTLKYAVPHLKNKVSKVETLKAAVDYIKALKELLGQEDDCEYLGPVLIGEFGDDTDNGGDSDKSGFSDLQSNSPFAAPGSPDLRDVSLHPMVYQLPSSLSTFHPSLPSLDTSPSSLKLSPATSMTYLIPMSLPATTTTTSV